MACPKSAIREEMIDYATKWHGLHPNISQTSLFRQSVPSEAIDFGETFQDTGLNQIFTGERLRTGPGFNCNHLYRSSRNEADIILYSDNVCTVLHPLGEPGRDVDRNKIGHLMVIGHSEEGAVTFNEMLPSTFAEVSNLEHRIEAVQEAVGNLRANRPIKFCGPKVLAKADKMDISHETGIQEFFMRQIVDMDPQVRNGSPGYKLFDDGYTEGATTTESLPEEIPRTEITLASPERILEEIRRVFSAVNIAAPTNNNRVFIQGPHRNTQILSHIHSFMVGQYIPPNVEQNYIDASYILAIKKDFLDDVPLVRTRTPPPPIMQQGAVDFEQEVDGGEDDLSRQSSVMVGR
jgi:hypothetical protein